MINKLALFINHNIFLTNEQLEKILNKKTIKVVGASVPVWMNTKTGRTTEPAKEFFCYYKIYYESKEDKISKFNNGYNIFLEKVELKKEEGLSLKEILKMDFQERKKYEKKIFKSSLKNTKPHDLKQLTYSRPFVKKILELGITMKEIENSTIDIQHVLNIKKTEQLEKSFC